MPSVKVKAHLSTHGILTIDPVSADSKDRLRRWYSDHGQQAKKISVSAFVVDMTPLTRAIPESKWHTFMTHKQITILMSKSVVMDYAKLSLKESTGGV